MKAKTADNATAKDPLIGKFFHTLTELGKFDKQGHILAKVQDGFYLVEYFDFAIGAPSFQQIAKIEKMENWLIHNDADDMKYVCENYRHLRND